MATVPSPATAVVPPRAGPSWLRPVARTSTRSAVAPGRGSSVNASAPPSVADHMLHARTGRPVAAAPVARSSVPVEQSIVFHRSVPRNARGAGGGSRRALPRPGLARVVAASVVAERPGCDVPSAPPVSDAPTAAPATSTTTVATSGVARR